MNRVLTSIAQLHIFKRSTTAQCFRPLSGKTISERDRTDVWKQDFVHSRGVLHVRHSSADSGQSGTVRSKLRYRMLAISFAIGYLGIRYVTSPSIEPAFDFPYVVIGNDVTALMAARGIRLQDPKAKVLMIGEDDKLPYKKAALTPYILLTNDKLQDKLEYEYDIGQDRKRKVSAFYENEAYFLTPEQLKDKENGGIALLKNKKVTKLSKGSKSIVLDDGTRVAYEKCLVSAARKPTNLPVLEIAGEEVAKRTTLLIKSADDFLTIRNVVKAGKKIAVIGNGLVATDLATVIGLKTFDVKDLHVCQIFEEEGVMSHIFPAYLSKRATEGVKQHLVDVFPNKSIIECKYDKEADKVILKLNDGEQLYVDHIFVADKTTPELSYGKGLFSRKLKIDSDKTGYKVDDKFHVDDNIWAAGEGVSFNDIKLGRRRCAEGQRFEEIAGKLAGENMTGANKPLTFQPQYRGDIGRGIMFTCYGVCDSNCHTVSYFPLQSEAQKDEGEKKTSAVTEGDAYSGKGVVFYVDQAKVVGIMTWNIRGYHDLWIEDIARQVLKSNVDEGDIHEIAKRMKLNTFDEDSFEKMTDTPPEEEIEDLANVNVEDIKSSS